ncbi:probable insulin-like peptide 7 [Oppia nitens]|uniref:probable insulin-like peptide 7 n=1 Tax=Oppia nitens TaxID=1686743 RepID=UPI0023DC6C98|nr:probable insulin-like peptide 7 [Oppia nitens]
MLVLLFEATLNVSNKFVDGNTDLSDTSDLNKIFSLRSDDDWRQLWHSEKHKRCYQDLINHMEWVCDKDIYKLRRKRDLIEVETFTNEPFLSAKEATNMFGILRYKKSNNRRLNKRGIIDECCNGSDGCSWEEYAEYCPANGRLRT